MAAGLLDVGDLPEVGSVIVKKLRAGGYQSVEAVAVASSKELTAITGLTREEAKGLSVRARKLLRITFQTADELLKHRETASRLTTGSQSLDEILGGGVETQAILELIGEYGTGKTQICHSLCVTVQHPFENKGFNGGALYIDSEGTFRPERLVQIAEGYGMDVLNVLKNVTVARAFNSDHQILIAEKVDSLVKEKKLKLIIMDSVISHFRSEYIGRESLAERQQKLNKHLHRLLRTAEMYNIPVVITNQVVAKPDALFGAPNKPAGGHILAHLSTNRVYIRKGRQNLRIAKIIDSPNLPESECVFMITKNGIEDAPTD